MPRYLWRMSHLPEVYQGLSEKERALAKATSNGVSFEEAALTLGYKPEGISELKSTVTRKPEWIAVLHIETARRVVSLAPSALETIDQVKKGEIKEGAKVRLDAAKIILDRAGIIPPRAKPHSDGSEKTLGEMSLDELKSTQERLEREIESRARQVKAQELPASDDQASDLLG